MATKRTTATKASKSGKRALTIKKDTIKDLTPDAKAPRGGAITPYAPAVKGLSEGCAGITPYKAPLSY